MSKLIIGIDPGKEGGIAILHPHCDPQVWPMPLIGDGIDGAAIRSLVIGAVASSTSVTIGIEKVGAMPGQGVTSMFSFGFGCGIIEGVVQACGWPYVKIQPQAWQKVALEGVSPIYKSVKGQQQKDSKAMAEVAARRLFPDVNLLATERSKVSHKGIVDALLIAHYLRITNR
jgi:crossover junction endodeoxyribonuclease RuvC